MSIALGVGVGPVFGGGVVSGTISIKERISNGRVDFVMLGDSNQLYSGSGWDQGWHYGLLNAGYSMYATGLISAHENAGDGGGTGYGYTFNAGQPNAAFATSGAPQDAWLSKTDGYISPHSYAYLASGSFSGAENQGLILSANTCPLDPTHALQFDLCYGTFDYGSGQFRPVVRRNESPWTELAGATVTSTNTGVIGMSTISFSLSADAARAGWPLNYKFGSVAVGVVAPWFGLWMRASDPGVTAGFSAHTLFGLGGASARTMALSLQSMSDTSLSYYFERVRALQGDDKTVVIVVNSGLNDRNETLTSVGPGAYSDGDSAEAFADNIKGIVNRINDIWVDSGWSLDELFFVLMVSHPVSTPDDAELVSYRSALRSYGATLGSRCQVIDISALITADTMSANGWYASGGVDHNHLVSAGYNGIGDLIVGALI